MGKDINSSDISLRKIDKLIYLSYLNSVHLHKTSLELFSNEIYGLSYYLSVISLEEIGKAFMLSDFLWDSRFNGRYNSIEDEAITKKLGTSDFEEYLLKKIFSSHIDKQNAFIQNGHSDFYLFLANKRKRHKVKISKIVQDVVSGKLEEKKLNSIYVGLPKTNHHIHKEGKTINPISWSMNETLILIKRVHNEILSTSLRMYIEESYLESEFLENFLSISFLESLLSPIEYINAYNKRLLRKHVPEINLGI
jgi:AbiV family abortive infection protein